MDTGSPMMKIGLKQKTPKFPLIFVFFSSLVISLNFSTSKKKSNFLFDISKNNLVIAEPEKVLRYESQ